MEFTCQNLKKNSMGTRIIASIILGKDHMEQLSLIKKKLKEFNFYPELRWDLGRNATMNSCVKYLDALEAEEIPAIFTFRSHNKRISDEFYSIAKDYKNIVMDIDMEHYANSSLQIKREKLILSSHYLNEVETIPRMEYILSQHSGAIKLACPFTHDFLTGIFNNVNKIHLDQAVSIVPQDTGKKYLRIIAALLNSDFTYSYLEKPVAPSQFSLENLSSLISGSRWD